MSRRVLSVVFAAFVLLVAVVPLALAEGTLPPPPEIPEPGSLVLLGTGLAGLAGYVGLRLRARK